MKKLKGAFAKPERVSATTANHASANQISPSFHFYIIFLDFFLKIL